MVSISIQYEGDLRCNAIHDASGSSLVTDAPLDNNGKGESFSPTDLLATAIGTCMLTIMGIAANSRSLNIKGTQVHVMKHMIQQPIRRVGSLDIRIVLPKGTYSEHDLHAFHLAAKNCPVMMSIHPEIEINYTLSVDGQ